MSPTNADRPDRVPPSGDASSEAPRLGAPPSEDPPVDAPPSGRRRAAVLCAAVALSAALVTGGTGLIRANAAAAPRPPAAAPPTVSTLALERRDGHEVRRAYAARLEPAREASLAFESAGTLVEVAVDEGARVARGTVLARLDTRRLEAERARLAAAREALDSDAELARLALARQSELETRGFAPGEALDEARLGVSRIASRVAEADAALALVDVELDEAVLRAPFDAVVGARALDPGATVAPGTEVLALFEDVAPRLRVGLPAARAAALDPDRAHRFVADGRTVSARLVARRPDVDPRTRTVSTLFAPVEGEGDALLFGELLELELVERVPGEVFEVPLAALAEDERGLWSVMTVTDRHAARSDAADGPATGPTDDPADGGATLARAAVEIVHLDGERAWVAADLADGTLVVADGRHRTVDGERVRLARAGEGAR